MLGNSQKERPKMSDRKNLKINPDTFELLRGQKGQYQTWDQFFWDEFGENE